MIIVGIDMSMNSPAVVKFELDHALNIAKKEFITFTQTKKYSGENIIYHSKTQFNNEYQKYIFMRDYILKFINGAEYAAIEGYAFNGTGQVFQIAEITGLLKVKILEFGIPLRIYDPASIKMSIGNKGNCDKISMEEKYSVMGDGFDLSYLPFVHEKKAGNPKDNIIDAFCIAKLLLAELKVRNGYIERKDLSEGTQRIFNRVTPANPVKILDLDFLRL